MARVVPNLPGVPALTSLLGRLLRPLELLPRRRWPFVQRGHFPTRPKELTRLLPKNLLEETTIRMPDRLPSLEGRAAETWLEVGRSHKWLHYFPVYERAFSHLVGRPVRFLEIGVYNGGSLGMWKSYFGSDATIVGIDIDPRCAAFENPENDIHVRIGSQADEAFLLRLIDEFGPFDAVLDDGSHRIGHIVFSFGRLFDQGLGEGGIYAVEDTHATYWPKFRDVPFSISDFCRYLSDLMHAHYVEAPAARYYLDGHKERLREARVPRLAQLLERIEIFDSIVLITKAQGCKLLPVNVDLPKAKRKPELVS